MNINDRVPAAKKLRGWIDLQGFTMDAAGAHFGVTRQAVYRWLGGKAPKFDQMVKIERETGIPLADWVEK